VERLLRLREQAGYPADRQQHDLANRDAKALSHQAMAQLVQNHASKDAEHEQRPEHGAPRAMRLRKLRREQHHHQRKCEMHPNVDAGDAAETERPTHSPSIGLERSRSPQGFIP
jgi:hypothetical protein